MGKHVPGSFGMVREDNEQILEWNEQKNKVTFIIRGDRMEILYDEAGTFWRMLDYLLIRKAGGF
jgi:hypothetical protein